MLVTHSTCTLYVPPPLSLSEDAILTAFPWQQWLCEHASMLPSYGHCLSCICRDAEDIACSTFRRPNARFSVNKNKELEFLSSNKVHSLQKSVPTSLTSCWHYLQTCNVKSTLTSHTPSTDGSQLQEQTSKKRKLDTELISLSALYF
jgi:hypothetical protein